jgi:hypothetical protein
MATETNRRSLAARGCLASTSSLKTYLLDLSREGVTTLERLAAKLHRAYCRRVTAIDFLLNAQYVLVIDNLTGKVEGEESWKTLKAPLQANS